jgi:hypothetical protein
LIDFEVWGFVLCWLILRWEVSFCVEWFWGERFLLCWNVLRWEVSCVEWFPQNQSTQKKPLTSKSFKTKRNLSPQNQSTQKRPLTSKS